MNVQDAREEMVNELCFQLCPTGEFVSDFKSKIYMIISKYEIMNRTTEIAILKEDRNNALLRNFLIAKKVSGRTQRTLLFYKQNIEKTLATIGKTVDDITSDDIRLYIALRMNRDNVSKVTVGNEIRSLSSFFNWLQAEDIIQKNPMLRIDRIKQEKTKKEALQEMEIERLRLAVRDEREKMIIEVLLSTGCRVTEFVNILLCDIDKDKILVRGKGEKDRYVYLNAKAIMAVEVYRKERKDSNPYLNPKGNTGTIRKQSGGKRSELHNWWKHPEQIGEGHTTASSIENTLRKLAKRAGVERANPHKFRRTCATTALRRGMPIELISELLGHEELSTTQIYLDISEDDLAAAHKKYVV